MDDDIPLEAHLERAAQHRAAGDTVAGGERPEWAAVCYFYAAYHLALYCIQSDPIFEDPKALARVDVNLTMEDRFTRRHKARIRQDVPPEWGVNALVRALYGMHIGSIYERLHQASVIVRYKGGLPADADVARFAEYLEEIEQGHAAGVLVHKAG